MATSLHGVNAGAAEELGASPSAAPCEWKDPYDDGLHAAVAFSFLAIAAFAKNTAESIWVSAADSSREGGQL